LEGRKARSRFARVYLADAWNNGGGDSGSNIPLWRLRTFFGMGGDGRETASLDRRFGVLLRREERSWIPMVEDKIKREAEILY
jgi:hypothetical protein